MHRTWLLITIPLFLLVGTASADEVDEKLQAQIQEAAEKVELLLVEADRTEDPRKKEALRAMAEAARARWKALRAKREKRQKLLAAEGPHHQDGPATLDADDAYRLAEQTYRELRAALARLEAERTRLLETRTSNHATVRELEAKHVHLQESMRGLEHARELFEEAKARLEGGRREAARQAFEEAVRHVREVHEGMKPQRSDRAGRFRVEGLKGGRVRLRVQAPEQAGVRERIEHLRAAAEHLHHAGLHEAGRGVEMEIHKLQQQLARAERPHHDGPEGVMEAIRDLQREVRQLRQEVRELRQRLD